MKRTVAIAVVCVGLLVPMERVLAVQLTKADGAWTVANAHYTATFDLKNGGVLQSVAYDGKPFPVGAGFTATFDGQPAAYNGLGHVRCKPIVQRVQKVEARIVSEDAKAVVLEFSWPLGADGKVVQTVTCDDTAAVRYVHDVSWTKRLNTVSFGMASTAFSDRHTTIFPEKYGVPTTYMFMRGTRYPLWKFATDGAHTFGLAMAEDSNWDEIQRGHRPGVSGWTPQISMAVSRTYLANLAEKGEKRFTHALLLAKTLAVARKCAAETIGEQPRVQLTDIIPDKVHTSVGGDQGALFTLISNSAKEETVKVTVEVVSGYDKVWTVSEEDVTLKAGEIVQKHPVWNFPKDIEWGVTTRVTVCDAAGETLDYRADVTSVTDFAPSATGTAIVNAGNCNKDGAEEAYAMALKMGYSGIIEYHAWAHATWDPERKVGLTPEADEWEPMTEDNAAYRSKLTKKFVKELVKACHRNGVHVYAWITGLCNYRIAVAHPEMFAHTSEGQIAIYNGKYWGPGARIATAKLQPYTEEAAADWGDQFADSIDMFGWDGCRFDWNFQPSAPNDPLYEDQTLTSKQQFVTRNWKGQASKDLWPDSDDVGTRCLRAWREAITKRHPKFIYAANGWSTDAIFKMTPKYSKYASTHSIRLTEYLLDVIKRSPTYRSWGAKLTEDTQNVRRCGGQTMVGFMRQIFGGSMGTDYAYYTCFASGSKWWGAPGEVRAWKHRTGKTPADLNSAHATPFAIRFAEYFWGNDFLLVPADVRTKEVQVRSAAKLYWDQFVYERKVADGREVVVHVINVDPDQYITVRQDRSPVREDVTVEVAPRAGETLVGATALLPGDEPKAVKLAVSGNTVRMPPLHAAASVVLKFAAK